MSSSHDLESSSRIPIATGLAGYVATTGHFVNVKDAYADERFDPAMDKRTGFRTASVLAVAVRDQASTVCSV